MTSRDAEIAAVTAQINALLDDLARTVEGLSAVLTDGPDGSPAAGEGLG
jgi:hypothetical protein